MQCRAGWKGGATLNCLWEAAGVAGYGKCGRQGLFAAAPVGCVHGWLLLALLHMSAACIGRVVASEECGV
eukprot:365943-Chlamydomonas_euryale.AAC.13